MQALSQPATERPQVRPDPDSKPVRVYAAGSLKAAFGDMASTMAADGVAAVNLTFGAAGLLKDRISGGEACDVFASANMAHPRALCGSARQVKVFAQNRLCALLRPGLDVKQDSLLQRMLDPAIHLGTSTRSADPSGDYAIEVFARAEQIVPGARDRLSAKALRLTGGPGARGPAEGRSVYSDILARGDADIFLTYVTNALTVVREAPGTSFVELPAPLAVAAEYGLVVLSDRRAAGAAAEWILSPAGQDILVRHGFGRGA